MSWRRNELLEFSDALAWLEKEEAAKLYSSALSKMSTERYGLDERFWEISARWDVDHVTDEDGRERLSAVISSEEFFMIFDRDDVARLSRSTFLAHWRTMFLPSRDDVVIISPAEEWCLFYCHEDEFEFGRRKKPIQPPDRTRLDAARNAGSSPQA